MTERLPPRNSEKPKISPLHKEKLAGLKVDSAKSRRDLCATLDAQFDPKKFQNDPDIIHPEGEYSCKELANRTRKLTDGVFVRYDNDINFYLVQKGDTLAGIKAKLAKFPEFAYLKNLSKVKLKSFNIPPKALQLGMWIPIPDSEGDEQMDEIMFKEFAALAIVELKANKIYGAKVEAIIKKVGQSNLENAMLAVARSESGGRLGQFADRRYEPDHKCFSYTIFHVLMEGAGLKARKNLGMTEGQTLHPKNSVKLFLAFLLEKSGRKDAARFFPLDEHLEEFATFYNGGKWKERNPDYADKLGEYYEKSGDIVRSNKY